MPKSIRQVREDLLNVPHDNKAASGPDVIKRTQNIARQAQKPSVKNKITALAGKQYEPNRTKPRHPSTPHQHITGPNELGGMSEATSQEGEFNAAESNKEFAEKLKQMTYKNAKSIKEIRESMKPKVHSDLMSWKSHAQKRGHDLQVGPNGIHAYTHKPGKPGKLAGFWDNHSNQGWMHEEKDPRSYTAHDYSTMDDWQQAMKKHGATHYNQDANGQTRAYRHMDVNRVKHVGTWDAKGKMGWLHEGKEEKKAFMTQLHKDQFHYHHSMWQKAEGAGDRDAAQHHGDMAHHHAYWHKKISGQDVIPHFKSKGPMNEGRDSEYSANRHLSSTSSMKRKPGHYLMRHGVPIHNEPHSTSQQALSAYHNLSDKSNVKISHVKEEFYVEQFLLGDKVCIDCAKHPRKGQIGTLQGVDHLGGHHVSFKDGHQEPFQQGQLQKMNPRQTSAVGSISSSGVAESVAMAAGAAGDPGAVQDPTSNYAAQLDQRRVKRPIKLFRRPRPGSTMSGNKP